MTLFVSAVAIIFGLILSYRLGKEEKDAPMTTQDLEDLMDEAIDNSLGPDWTSRVAAKAVVEALDGTPSKATILALEVDKAALVEAGNAFVVKLDECQPYIDNATVMETMRGRPYLGPTYGTELEAFRATLAKHGVA